MAEELALLRRFRDLYSIDQTVFYTGGNDAILHYLRAATPQRPHLVGGPHAFEVIKKGRPSPLRQIPGTGCGLAGQDGQRGPAAPGAHQLLAQRD